MRMVPSLLALFAFMVPLAIDFGPCLLLLLAKLAGVIKSILRGISGRFNTPEVRAHAVGANRAVSSLRFFCCRFFFRFFLSYKTERG